MKLETLRSKAKKNTLEVEHILAAAKACTHGLKDELHRLSLEYDWSNSIYLPDGTHVVPFGKWAEIAGAYADGGFNALSELANNPDNTSYVIGLLEELKSHDAVDALIDIFSSVMLIPESNPETAWRLVQAYNQLLSIKNSVVPTDRQAESIRNFLISFFPIATTETMKAWVVYALRDVGNDASLDFISNVPEFSPLYKTAKSVAMRAIRKRLHGVKPI